MVRKVTAIYTAAWRIALASLTIQIAAVSFFRYFTDLIPPPPPVAANAFADPFLAIHVASSVLALLVGPLQLVSAIRTRWPRIHRATGRIYVLACAIGAPSGLVLALGTTSGPVAGAGFAMLALLWPALTWLGVRAALERRLEEHREWMLRSFAMAAAAITLRLMLPAAGFLGVGFSTAYPVIAWLCWTMNLAIVEYYIHRTRPAGGALAKLATV